MVMVAVEMCVPGYANPKVVVSSSLRVDGPLLHARTHVSHTCVSSFGGRGTFGVDVAFRSVSLAEGAAEVSGTAFPEMRAASLAAASSASAAARLSLDVMSSGPKPSESDDVPGFAA